VGLFGGVGGFGLGGVGVVFGGVVWVLFVVVFGFVWLLLGVVWWFVVCVVWLVVGLWWVCGGFGGWLVFGLVVGVGVWVWLFGFCGVVCGCCVVCVELCLCGLFVCVVLLVRGCRVCSCGQGFGVGCL
jgi:hypothetical protein